MNFLPNNNQSEMICFGLSALAFGFFGIFLLIYYFRTKKKTKKSMTWPSVEGKITGQRVEREEVFDDDGLCVVYRPEVYYHYIVDEISYTGSRIDFGNVPSFGARKKAEAYLEPYPEEQVVTVFYNPDDPQDAVLSQTMQKMVWGLVVGILTLVVSIAVFCAAAIGVFKAFFQ